MRRTHWTYLPLAALLAFAPIGCDKKAEPAPPQAAPTEPTPATPDKAPTPDNAPTPDKEPAPTPTAPTPTPTPDTPTPTPTEAPPTASDKPVDITATPGTIVRDPAPASPEWLIQQVLVASLEPDFEKGWALFESLLHEDQKVEKALISRKQFNYPASRRKVHLFIFEDGPKPIYRVDRLVPEGPNQYRFFLHNKSPDSMPTPCEVRYDENIKKWGIGICSL